MEEVDFNKDLIVRCLSNTASADEQQELMNWMEASPIHSQFYFVMKDLYEAGSWKNLQEEAKTQEGWKLIKAKIQQNAIHLTTPKPALWKSMLKYAAVLLLGILISAIVFKLTSSSNNEYTNQVITGIGERSQMVLPDGTRIWVNSCSAVSYNQEYGIKTRDVYLQGEAYFKVAKNKKVPFIVHTDKFNVKALGTSFNVTAYDNDPELSAVLLEGSISFDLSENGPKTVLLPDEKIYYSPETGKTRVEKVNAANSIAWSMGESRFEHLTMDEIIKRLQRLYHVTFILENDKIRDMHFTGTFRNYESLDQILKVITTNTNLNCKLIRDTVYMK